MIKDESISSLSVRGVFSALLPYLKPFKISFIIAGILILFSTAIDISKPMLIGKAVDATVEKGATVELLYPICYLFLSLIVMEFLVDAVKSYIVQIAGQKITHKLRSDLFTRVTHFPVSYYDKNPVGRVLTRIVNDIKTLGEVFTASIAVIALDVILIAGTMGAMIWMDWRLGLAVLAGFPLVIISIHVFGKRLATAYRKARAKLSEINAFLGENIGAIATIQRLAAEKPRFEKFSNITEDHFKAQMHSLVVYANLHPITNTLNGVAMTTLLLLGGTWAMEGRISLGVLVAFIGYIRNLFIPIRDLVEKYNQLLSARVSAERVFKLLQEPVEMIPVTNFVPNEKEIVGLEFKNVRFTYPSRGEVTLDDISFKLPAGSSLAVVGPTGSGKSTLVRLLLRFYDIDSGQIYVGDKALYEWDKRTLRSHFGVVHQEIYLLQGSLRENLTLGARNYPDEFLIEQCEKAQLWSFVKDRGGLDMEIYEGGANLSIGQKQLVSFARILVFDPPILILDEATASVDRIVEEKLMEATRQTIAGRTSIVIAHRLSTIKTCDDTIVIENGRLRSAENYAPLLKEKTEGTELSLRSQ